MSERLVSTFESDFDPSKFSDDYQDQLRQLIDAKLAHGDDVDTAATFGETGEDEHAGGEVLDLMEALRRSVQASRGRKPAAAKKPSVVKETVVAKKAVSAKKRSVAKKPSAAKKSAASKKQSASIKFGVKRAG